MIDILRSEWTKIRSVRSTVWTLAATVGLMVGLSALLSFSVKNVADGPVPGLQAIAASLQGIMFAQVAIATLGVLVISSEYRTGGIRTSLMSVPRRMRLLTGKLVVFGATSLVVSALASAAALGVGVAFTQPPALELGEVVRALVGASLYLTACGLFGLGLGTLVRHTPGAIVAAIALMLVLPQVVNQLPGQWGRLVAEHFTTNAGLLLVVGEGSDSLSPWGGFGVYLAWVAVATIAGAVLMQRRDA
ncbi:ABC transporter permease subunit [Nonomuraea rubra]|uniref:ABC transporter permease subunit n=1 Tax=Nonomuraea rubra TaxID=46180 RepID=UPI00340A907B